MKVAVDITADISANCLCLLSGACQEAAWTTRTTRSSRSSRSSRTIRTIRTTSTIKIIFNLKIKYTLVFIAV